MERKRVAIVGAGISGLAACKQAVERGFDPAVFESEGGVGGVWARTLDCTRLQSPRTAYQFSDFPWPDAVSEVFPDHLQVMDYLRAYAHEFALFARIKFAHRVLGIDYVGVGEGDIAAWEMWAGNGDPFGVGVGRGEWHLTVQHQDETEVKNYHFSFTILH